MIMMRSQLIKLFELYMNDSVINKKTIENVNEANFKTILLYIDKFNRNYSKDVESLVNQFYSSKDDNLEQQLSIVIQETFVTGVTWGRIISLLSFVFNLCKCFLNNVESEYIEPIINITAKTLETLNIELSSYFSGE